MTKGEFVAMVADRGDITRKQAETELALIFDTLAELLAKGEAITIPGFGKFSVSTRNARTGINPRTKEKIQIPETKAPSFSAALALKDAVKK